MIKRTNEVTEYEYYVGGNLKQVTLPDATEIEYLYDANSNRIQKTTATEIINYHYAGSELKSEVHQNKQNTILYTLTYYPYGFSKTVGQTTTAYYYIYDNRGFVWALTDDAGDIVETYDYSPYGELLSTPTLTNHLFLSGADQCMYDAESNMVHLNNRYYLPKLGRFLQRDSVEGSPTATISQNLYTYCQNSPITLIDPSGNTPQNTGTPPRPSSVNAAAFGGDMSCYMPDINQPVAAIAMNLEAIEKDTPSNAWGNDGDIAGGGSPATEFDSCNYVVEITNDWDKILGRRVFKVVSNGVAVKVTETTDEHGRRKLVAQPFAYPPNKGEAALCEGLNAGFKELYDDPTITNDQINSINTFNLLGDTVNFTSKNYTTFSQISNEGKAKFLKHAVIGTFASYFMSQTTIFNEKEYNQTIGFWVSYFAERATNIYNREHNTNQKIYMFDHTGKDSNGKSTNILGLVGIGNMTKAIVNAEHGTGKTINNEVFTDKYIKATSDEGHSYGIMNLNDDGWYKEAIDNGTGQPGGWLFKGLTFGNSNWKSNAFANIGGGVGFFFTNIRYGTAAGTGFHTNLSESNWLVAAYWYNDIDKEWWYGPKIRDSWKLFNKIKGGK